MSLNKVPIESRGLRRNKYVYNSPKDHFGEDDNEDISYFNIALFWPFLFNLTFMVVCILLSMLHGNHSVRTIIEQMYPYDTMPFGKHYVICKNLDHTRDLEWPSVLRPSETFVFSSIMFRLGCSISFCYRFFLVFILRFQTMNENAFARGVFGKIFNELSFVCGVAEILALHMLSGVSIKLDSKSLYVCSFRIFIFCNAVNMILRTFIQIQHRLTTTIDDMNTVFKLVCTIIFTWQCHYYYYDHLKFAMDPQCHSYISGQEAMSEYLCWIAYIGFNLTHLWEIRDLRTMIYPRTISGECEPLDPENYKYGKRYEQYN